MFSKKYKLTQHQVDEMNLLYYALQDEIGQLKEQVLAAGEGSFMRKEYLTTKAENVMLMDENVALTTEIKKQKKSIMISNNTMTAVLEKLHEMSIKYDMTMLLLDCNLPKITSRELDILA